MIGNKVGVLRAVESAAAFALVSAFSISTLAQVPVTANEVHTAAYSHATNLPLNTTIMVGHTSYDSPPFRSQVMQPAAGPGTGGLGPQHLHWLEWPENYPLNGAAQSCRELEARGIVPCIGMQGWGDVYSQNKARPENPALNAWIKWSDDRPQLLDRKLDGTLPGSFWPDGHEEKWHYISPAMPLDPADMLSGTGVRTYGDWMAERYGALCGHLGGIQGVLLSDFYDSLPHLPVTEHDFNPRIIDDFAHSLGVKIPGSTTADRGHYILSHYRVEWTDYWCHAYARFWGRMAESIKRHNPQGLGALIVIQCEHPVAQRRLAAMDNRIVAATMAPGNVICGWDAQRMVGHRKNYAPESAIPSILGIAAAREPLIRNFPNMECDVKDFWDGVDLNWPGLTSENRHELGLKRLKRLWLETAWAHIADRQGKTRRAVCAFERYYWDGGKIDPDLVALYQAIRPVRPFGPALYYSVAVERACERLGEVYLGDFQGALPDLRERGLALNYYVSDAALARIGSNIRPAYWIIPHPPTMAALPAAERARLESISPIVSEDEALKSNRNPLRFSGGNHGLTGFGFYDQHNRLIIVVNDRIVKGDSNNSLPATTATVEVHLPDGRYTAREIPGGASLPVIAIHGRIIFRTALPRWDTKVFAIERTRRTKPSTKLTRP